MKDERTEKHLAEIRNFLDIVWDQAQAHPYFTSFTFDGLMRMESHARIEFNIVIDPCEKSWVLKELSPDVPTKDTE